MNVEVRPSLINKGNIIKRAVTQNPEIEFIFCAGDDRTDEDMFRILERMELGGRELILFTVIVGNVSRKTIANWKVDASQDLIHILQDLTVV